MTEQRKRGFGSMDPALQRAIATEGGKAVHRLGRAHRFTTEEAREAGRKGGIARGKAYAAKKAAGEQALKANWTRRISP